MTTNINETLSALQARIEAAQQRRARAQADHDLATKHRDEAMAELQEKFGTTDLSQAVTLLKQYEGDLERLVQEAETALAEAEA